MPPGVREGERGMEGSTPIAEAGLSARQLSVQQQHLLHLFEDCLGHQSSRRQRRGPAVMPYRNDKGEYRIV